MRHANAVLTSGFGGVSCAVQGSISMTVALPIPDTSVKYRPIFVICSVMLVSSLMTSSVLIHFIWYTVIIYVLLCIYYILWLYILYIIYYIYYY